MASSFNYFKYIKLIEDKIDYYGGYVSYYQNVDTATNTVTNLSSSHVIVTPVKVLISNYKQFVVDGEMIRKGDRQIYMQSTLGKPKVGDNVAINNTLYRVIEVKEVAPGVDDVLLYILQVRSYSAVANPLDVLRLTLGELAAGTTVVDPYALDVAGSPEWKVVAHDHHATDVTTLMTTKAIAYRSFDGSAEGGNYLPSTPWKSTALRKWLSTGDTFQVDYLSSNFIGLLQTVNLETQTNVYPDTMSIASYEELFGTALVSSSGSPIPYFDSNAKRAILWFADDTPRAYWTRDIVSGTAPNWTIRTVSTTGTSSNTSDGSKSGVVPMCYLQKALNVVLRDDGKYVLEY